METEIASICNPLAPGMPPALSLAITSSCAEFIQRPMWDMIDASRRVLVCRIAKGIENDQLLVINPSGWLNRIID